MKRRCLFLNLYSMWVQMIEQTLLIIVVIGRWLLPKGKFTRDELSQLLLAYVAISSDIVELFTVFKWQEVRLSMKLTLVVLILWTISLIQFPLILTTSRGQKVRFAWKSSRSTLIQKENRPESRLVGKEYRPESGLVGKEYRPGSTLIQEYSQLTLVSTTEQTSIQNSPIRRILTSSWLQATSISKFTAFAYFAKFSFL